jgi:BirA family biotin operon repressor/biotin-[acetyl-CoA-carboxylase] ligase
LRKNSNSLPATSTNRSIGNSFKEILCVDSTNNYAMRQVHEGIAAHGNVYFAHQQTAGKGQRGKQWHSAPGENIMLSVVLNTNDLPVSNMFILNMAIALAAKDFFAAYVDDNTLIKWPNDLYWCDRKAAGILIENIIRGNEWQWSIAGIGININQRAFDETIVNPVSLKQITGKNYNSIELAKELCTHLEKHWQQFLHNEKESIVTEYNEALYKHKQKIKLKKNNIIFEALLLHVNESGQLIVDAGVEQTFNVDEVEWVLI